MRQVILATDCYYHIYNRGVEKRTVFQNKWDYQRFLETINYYRLSPTPGKLSDFRRGVKFLKDIKDQKMLVKIFCYCLMPNHFHLLVQQLEDNGITKFLHRLLDSYTRYFNIKYDRVGSLFQGTFQAKLIENDSYLLQLSKYIHRNPKDISNIQEYSYSSYPFYLSGNLHPFCDTEFIESYFSKTNPRSTYQSFVEETEVDDPTLFDLMIDTEDYF